MNLPRTLLSSTPRRGLRALLGLLVVSLAGCATTATPASPSSVDRAAPPTPVSSDRGEPEAVSLLGVELFRPQLSEQRRSQLEANLAAARADYDADPSAEENIIWLGRRTAYLSRYRQAIEIYSAGLDQHPDSFRLLRHRGHRYISVRRFDDAIADLSRAAALLESTDDEIEADGVPNSINTPLSTTQFNIWYHLGLAHYLKGEFEEALAAYRRCLEVSTNSDLLVATSDWMYMTLRRLGRDTAREAAALLEPITADLAIVENDAYHRRLLMYKGEIAPDDLLDLRAVDDPDHALAIATQGYGVGNWYLVNGQTARALDVFEAIVEGTSWAAFGYIAAEADLARLR